MKKSFLLIISLYIAFFPLYAQQTPSRIEKKNFSDASEIRLNHSYGNITVTESASNQVELEIRYFDYNELKPSCDISLSNKVLDIKTVRPRNYNSVQFKRMGIDYILAVPKDVAMDLNLKYGNINMGDYYGNFKCDLAYSNISTNTLHNSPVSIVSKYSNIKISTVDVLDLSMSYGMLRINTVQRLKINSKYSKFRIDKADIIDAICSYGGIDIASIDEFEADLRYTPVNIDYLDKKLNLACSHSNIKIDKSSNDLKEIDFDGSYSNFRLGLAADLSANLYVDLKYGNLSVDDKLEVKYSFSETDYERQTKEGVIGNKTPTANIRIADTYAKVNIYASSGELSMQNTDSIVNRWSNIYKNIQDNLSYAIANERMHERVREEVKRVREEANRVREDANRMREEVKRMREEANCVREEANRVREEANRAREDVNRMREIVDTIKTGNI